MWDSVGAYTLSRYLPANTLISGSNEDANSHKYWCGSSICSLWSDFYRWASRPAFDVVLRDRSFLRSKYANQFSWEYSILSSRYSPIAMNRTINKNIAIKTHLSKGRPIGDSFFMGLEGEENGKTSKYQWVLIIFVFWKEESDFWNVFRHQKKVKFIFFHIFHKKLKNTDSNYILIFRE